MKIAVEKGIGRKQGAADNMIICNTRKKCYFTIVIVLFLHWNNFFRSFVCASMKPLQHANLHLEHYEGADAPADDARFIRNLGMQLLLELLVDAIITAVGC